MSISRLVSSEYFDLAVVELSCRFHWRYCKSVVPAWDCDKGGRTQQQTGATVVTLQEEAFEAEDDDVDLSKYELDDEEEEVRVVWRDSLGNMRTCSPSLARGGVGSYETKSHLRKFGEVRRQIPRSSFRFPVAQDGDDADLAKYQLTDDDDDKDEDKGTAAGASSTRRSPSPPRRRQSGSRSPPCRRSRSSSRGKCTSSRKSSHRTRSPSRSRSRDRYSSSRRDSRRSRSRSREGSRRRDSRRSRSRSRSGDRHRGTRRSRSRSRSRDRDRDRRRDSYSSRRRDSRSHSPRRW